MGATNAVIEMLAHTAGGVLRVFPAIPAEWHDVRFEGIRTEGALLVSSERRGGATRWVRIHADAPTRVRLANPFAGPVRVQSSRGGAESEWDGKEYLERVLERGEGLFLSPA
jgi:hypothetical protein